MATIGPVNVDASDVFGRIDVVCHVKGMWFARVRFALGLPFLRLGAWVAGIGGVRTEC